MIKSVVIGVILETGGGWHVTQDMWHLTPDMWHVTGDTLHIKRHTFLYFFLLKIQKNIKMAKQYQKMFKGLKGA